MSPRPNIELTPDEQAAFLLERHKCALATYGPDGFPHIVAMRTRPCAPDALTPPVLKEFPLLADTEL